MIVRDYFTHTCIYTILTLSPPYTILFLLRCALIYKKACYERNLTLFEDAIMLSYIC